MSVVSRRDALKLTAAGAALASAGSLAAQAVAAHENGKEAQAKPDVKQLEERINALRQLVAQLADEKDLEEVLNVVRKADWKPTPAEIVLLVVVVNVLLAVAKAVVAVKKDLLKASREVAAR